MKSNVNIDLQKNQLLNAIVHPSSTAPTSPVAGQIYYNTSSQKFFYYDGSAWTSVNEKVQNAIKFTGFSTGSYNGSSTLTIDIPELTSQLINNSDFVSLS